MNSRPKLLTENGNFVIESAVDKNISFRLKGSSYLNINDINVMRLFSSSNQSVASSSNLALRLTVLEEQFRHFPSLDNESTTSRSQNMLQRLSALERKFGNSRSNVTFTSMNRRIRQLESKMNKLMTRLNTNNCTSNPCQNGGTCTSTFGGYECRCPDAWTGVNCNEDVNECVIFADSELGCQNSLSCENTPGGYKLVNVYVSIL